MDFYLAPTIDRASPTMVLFTTRRVTKHSSAMVNFRTRPGRRIFNCRCTQGFSASRSRSCVVWYSTVSTALHYWAPLMVKSGHFSLPSFDARTTSITIHHLLYMSYPGRESSVVWYEYGRTPNKPRRSVHSCAMLPCYPTMVCPGVVLYTVRIFDCSSFPVSVGPPRRDTQHSGPFDEVQISMLVWEKGSERKRLDKFIRSSPVLTLALALVLVSQV